MNPALILETFLKVLSDKALVFLTLLLNFGLFAYAVAYPDAIRFATAGLFSLTVFCPVLRSITKGKANEFQEA